MPRKDPAARKAYMKAYRKAYQKTTKYKAYFKTAKRKTYMKAYRKTAKYKAYMKAYANTAKRRVYLKTDMVRAMHAAFHAFKKALKLGVTGKWTAKQFLTLCDKYDNRCLCCGKKRKLTPDHVIPMSKGGSNRLSNIQPLCLPCNMKKGNNSTDHRKNWNHRNGHSNTSIAAASTSDRRATA